MEQQLRSWSASDEHDLRSKHHFDECTGSLNIYWEYQGITERKYSHEGGGRGKKGERNFMIYSTKSLEEYNRQGDMTSSQIIEKSDTNISTNQSEPHPDCREVE